MVTERKVRATGSDVEFDKLMNREGIGMLFNALTVHRRFIKYFGSEKNIIGDGKESRRFLSMPIIFLFSLPFIL